jgi:hypothetical protein
MEIKSKYFVFEEFLSKYSILSALDVAEVIQRLARDLTKSFALSAK